MGDIQPTLIEKQQFREITGLLKDVNRKLDALLTAKSQSGRNVPSPSGVKIPVDKGSAGAKLDAMKKGLEGNEASKK